MRSSLQLLITLLVIAPLAIAQAPSYCFYDANGDGVCDMEDLYAFSSNRADINGDGVIDAEDRKCLERFVRMNEAFEMHSSDPPRLAEILPATSLGTNPTDTGLVSWTMGDVDTGLTFEVHGTRNADGSLGGANEIRVQQPGSHLVMRFDEAGLPVHIEDLETGEVLRASWFVSADGSASGTVTWNDGAGEFATTPLVLPSSLARTARGVATSRSSSTPFRFREVDVLADDGSRVPGLEMYVNILDQNGETLATLWGVEDSDAPGRYQIPVPNPCANTNTLIDRVQELVDVASDVCSLYGSIRDFASGIRSLLSGRQDADSRVPALELIAIAAFVDRAVAFADRACEYVEQASSVSDLVDVLQDYDVFGERTLDWPSTVQIDLVGVIHAQNGVAYVVSEAEFIGVDPCDQPSPSPTQTTWNSSNLPDSDLVFWGVEVSYRGLGPSPHTAYRVSRVSFHYAFSQNLCIYVWGTGDNQYNVICCSAIADGPNGPKSIAYLTIAGPYPGETPSSGFVSGRPRTGVDFGLVVQPGQAFRVRISNSTPLVWFAPPNL